MGNEWLPWAFFVSGYGSNLEAALTVTQKCRVVTSNPDARAVQVARSFGLEILDYPKDRNNLGHFADRLRVDRIFLLGFMKVLPESFITALKAAGVKDVINLHPSLLPNFKGLNSIQRAYQENADIGVTIHHVVAEVDGGTIVDQQICWRSGEYEAKTLAEVEARVHELEHEMVKRVIEKWKVEKL